MMRKVLTALFVSGWILSYAQLKHMPPYTFHFSNPSQLIPSVVLNTDQVDITDSVFYTSDHFLKMSFSYDTGYRGARIFPQTIDSIFKPYLYMGRGSYMYIETTNSRFQIDTLYFSDDSYTGDIYLESPRDKGIVNYKQNWYSNGVEGVTSLRYRQNGEAPHIYGITVIYSVPEDLLIPTSSIRNGDVLPSFSSFELTFNLPVEVEDSTGMFVTGTTLDKPVFLSPQVTGNVVTLSLPEGVVLDKDGNFTITIPARRFRNTEGFTNEALQYSFKVYEPRNSFNYASVNPPLGTLKELPATISLDFDKGDGKMKYNVKSERLVHTFILYKDGQPYTNMIMTIDPEVKSVVNLTNEDNEVINEVGVWTLTIPEKVIHNIFMDDDSLDRWNPEIYLEYVVDTTTVVPEPVDSETMVFAKELIKTTGIGYPSENSPSRLALQALIDETKECNDSIDSLLVVCMTDFYNETDVTMPIQGNWYNIHGVNSENVPLYLTLDNEEKRVGISTSSKQQAYFQAVGVDGNNVVFATQGGKYLHALMSLPNYDKTSETNLTVDSLDVNTLTLSKFKASDVDSRPEDMFGLLTIKGSLGSWNGGEPDSVNVLLNYENNGSIASDPRYGDNLFFDAVRSNAFRVMETVSPDQVGIVPQFVLTPDTIESDTIPMMLTFTNIAKAKLVDGTKAFIRVLEKESVALNDSVAVTSVETVLTAIDSEASNTFAVHVNGLTNDSTLVYQLVVPVGTFDFSEDSERVKPFEEMSATFCILSPSQGSVDPDPTVLPEFNFMFETYSWLEFNQRIEKRIAYISDVDLNNFVLFIQVNSPYTGIVPDTKKQIRLTQYYTDKTLRTGHFEPYPEITEILGDDNYMAIKLVLDSPVKEGELQFQSGSYAYNLPAATFGDLNFGRYLEGDPDVKASDCLVNGATVRVVQVDNEIASTNGITSVLQEPESRIVYDLQGRPQTGTLKPGVYIINGQKRVVR